MNEKTANHPALELFEKLLAVPSPSGREERLAGIIRQHLEEMGYEPETDGAGNVLVRLEGKDPGGPKVIFAAHMDEIGMVVTAMNEDGSLRVSRSGGLFPYKLGEGPVDIIGDVETITGVLSMGSTHTADAASRAVKWEDVRVLTGLSVEQIKEKGIRPGTSAVPARAVRGPVVFGDPADPLVGAWTFGDRMGVVAELRLLAALKEREIQPEWPMLVAFTVHEEGGCHGAKVLAQRERPEVFIAVDGCPMPPETDLYLDGRPAAWSKDKKTHFDQALLGALKEAARRAGTDLQTAVFHSAFSDASAAYDVGAAARVATVGHVRENSHGYEIARLSVFDNLLETLVSFVEAGDLGRHS